MNTKLNNEITNTIEARYQRAKTLIQGFSSKSLVRNDVVIPTWIEGTECFWYERDTLLYKKASSGGDREDTPFIGKEYRLVDAKSASNTVAFDHGTLASSLGKASKKEVDPTNLPICHITLSLDPVTVVFTAFDKRWCFRDEDKTCREIKTHRNRIREAVSADSTKIAFTRDYNLWLRDVGSGTERALTTDGEEDNAYSTGTTAWGVSQSPETPGLWSSDSKRFLTVQHDKRLVKSLPSIDHVPLSGSEISTFENTLDSKTPLNKDVRPILRQAKVAYPGDEHIEVFRILSIDMDNGETCLAQHRPIGVNYNDYFGFYGKCVWWGNDDHTAYFIDPDRGDRKFHIVEFNTLTGETRVLFEETSKTHITFAGGSHGLALNRYLSTTNELVWWSERSGWGHLYLYDLNTGALKQTITQGDWRVREVLYVDEKHRELLIQTVGRIADRDPYYRDICRVSIDTGEITTLVSCESELLVHHRNSVPLHVMRSLGNADEYTDAVAPTGDYMVATQSRVDQGSSSRLLDRNGNIILELEQTDLSGLPEGWQWPEPFEVTAADGETSLYGALFRPSGFSPDKSYPVLNFISSGPWISVVPKASFHCAKATHGARHYFYAAALAELGFIVFVLDSRGTPLRSKAFQDESYGWVPSSANTADHAYAIEQLATRYPYMDRNRVGIFSQGYRSGLQNFMERQDLYKACVHMLCLDDRMTGAFVGEKYEGREPSPKFRQYPEQMVEAMEGRLMLMNSMSSALSTCYPPAATFRVISALQKANKDFDMLMVPHGEFGCDSYMFRRAFDFLIKNLLEETPPKEFLFDDVSM